MGKLGAIRKQNGPVISGKAANISTSSPRGERIVLPEISYRLDRSERVGRSQSFAGQTTKRFSHQDRRVASDPLPKKLLNRPFLVDLEVFPGAITAQLLPTVACFEILALDDVDPQLGQPDGVGLVGRVVIRFAEAAVGSGNIPEMKFKPVW